MAERRRRYPALYCSLVGARVRSQLEYPLSFVAELFTGALMALIDLFALWALFTNTATLAGWSADEVLVLYGIGQTCFAVANLLVGQTDGLPELIRSGRFDGLLMRPLGTLFQVLASDLRLTKLGALSQGGIVLAVGLDRSKVVWTPARAAVLAGCLPVGVVIFGSVWVLTNAVTFWLIDGREAANAFTYGGRQLLNYPLGIYTKWVRRFVLFVLPLAFVAYFPALFVLDKADPLDLPGWLGWLGPVAAALTAGAASTVWRLGVRSYRSVGA